MWGGLHPIPSRLALDALTLASLAYCALTEADAINAQILIVAASLTGFTVGLTHRWTVSLPMIPFVLLQGLRRVQVFQGEWTSWLVLICSVSLVIISGGLTVLFPAVKLRSVNGQHNVGCVDLHLPVDFNVDGLHENARDEKGYVTARLLYPTEDAAGWIPYLKEDIADILCNEFMKVGAPAPLQKLGWILHTWRLTHIQAKLHAKPLDLSDAGKSGKKLPLAVYSHGLTGNASIYSYQALNLAADGTVVLAVEHSDGSAIGLKKRDGSFVYFDQSIGKLEYVESVRRRRKQMDHRVLELLSSAVALRDLNCSNIEELESVGLSFVNKLDVQDLTLIGHSFGGGSVLAAAARRPDIVSCVVAHEPTTDWMPDDCRRALYPEERFVGAHTIYKGGTGGYEKEKESSCEEKKDASSRSSHRSIHDINMIFLFSHEWARQGWGSFQVLKSMHNRGKLGPPDGVSEVGFIYGSKHSEFSDSCMMTPTWLARGTGLTGSRNPHETAEEIGARTLDFIKAVRIRLKPEDSDNMN